MNLKSNKEWKKELSPEAYRVCREKGTEPPFSGKYCDFDEKGIYVCVACRSPLFASKDKYKSGCGWPSFTKPYKEKNIHYAFDKTHNMERVEILCAKCASHLGHVFPDGPKPTGKRYCVNSLSLDFLSQKE